MFEGKDGIVMSGRRRNDDAGLGCLVMIVMAIFAMPLVGLYMISKGDEGEKVIGVLLTIVGLILWCFMFAK